MDFVHLHVHSQYSILDGAASVEGLVEKAVNYNMKSLALTDHGNMFGIKLFFDQCRKKNIKPLMGVEAYLAEKGISVKSGKEDYSGHHLILIAKNAVGYKNLLRLCTIAATDGFYQKPRIDRNLLEQYGEGLIVTSACLGGEIPQKILANDLEGAEKAIQWYKSLFGNDFYLEIMRHFSEDPEMNRKVYDEQVIVNPYLIEAAKRHNIKLIATNDVHFINKEDADAHDLLICLNTGKDLNDPNRLHYTKQEYFKSPDEMAEIFADVPEAISNTLEIADKVEVFNLNSDPIMPYFAIPASFSSLEQYKSNYSENDLITEFGKEKYDKLPGNYLEKLRIKQEADYLLHITMEGARQRYGDPIPPEVTERINFEIDTIKTMGFPGYFLIVHDFVKFARDNGVLVGPGRGSAAGSAVAYCNGITDVDPIEHDLLFERFLNPDRISMPDVDIDFDDDGRQSVLNYVTEKYGKNNVAQIVTFGTMAAKLAIRDVARVLGLPLNEADRLTKILPEQHARLANAYNLIIEGEKRLGSIEKVIDECGREITIARRNGNDSDVGMFETRRIMAQEIIDARNKKDDIRLKTIQFACTLEGSVRQTAVHACGVLIGRDPLINNIPLMPSKESTLLCTQYDGHFVESVGLLKMDFLGLKTLSILRETLQNIKDRHGIDIDLKKIPFDDPEVFALFSRGETTGIFQFESDGMKTHLKNLRPTRFGDLVAMNALYRPGPMEYIPNFINRKNGREKIAYDHPIMEKYLEPTYGVTVYQEQVMLLSRALALFTRGESDSLRKAMGKKIESMMKEMKDKFVSGCHRNPEFMNGCLTIGKNPDELIDKIWKDWESFAKYAFNKSHSVCYAYLAYQTAYLKAHYPAEFMAACMSRNLSDIKEISKLMEECRRMRIKVLGPDVNESFNKFMVNKNGNIRFGMVAVKNVGTNAVNDIVSERKKNGPYTNIFNFVERVNLNSVNKKNMEALAYSGAFDGFEEVTRPQYFLTAPNESGSFIENLISYGNAMQSKKFSSHNLFGDSIEIETKKPGIPTQVPVLATEWLNHEKAHIGLYISAHPLDAFAFELKHMKLVPLSDLKDLNKFALKVNFKIAGLISSAESKVGKTGREYGRITIEDYTDSFTLGVYGDDFLNYNKFFQPGQCVVIDMSIVEGYQNQEERRTKISGMTWMNSVKDSYFKAIELSMDIDRVDDSFTENFNRIVRKCKGKIFLSVRFEDSEKQIQVKAQSKSLRVELNNEFVDFVENSNYFTNVKLY